MKKDFSKKTKTNKKTKDSKKGVTADAPFSTAEYVMVKPFFDDDDDIVNTQGS